jgi:7-cyano-7-deazaguanine synthase
MDADRPLVVAVVSGGMDSVTLAHSLANHGCRLHVVSFDYGQLHVRELACAARCAGRLGAGHDIVTLPIGDLLTTSALTGDVEVPDGHYAETSMRATVVPNRNLIMLAVAAAIAIDRGAVGVAVGVHSGDHFIYPDCRPAFIDTADHAIALANDGFLPAGWRGIMAPFIDWSKADIVSHGAGLLVPWEETWSCYRGGEVHCGRCGTCVERREAFDLAGVEDPTGYEDPDYWRDAVWSAQ